MKPAVVALVAAGGALGTAARYLVFEWWPVTAGTFPTTTLCVNVVGALALGVLISRWADVWWAPPLLGIGLLSGFTTMSGFAVEVGSLGRSGHWALATTYVGTSLVLGIAAAWTGLRIGHR